MEGVTLCVKERIGDLDPDDVPVDVRETLMLREEVAQLVDVLDGSVLLERVGSVVLVFDTRGLKVPVLEFVVDAVAVPVLLCVRDDFIETEEVELVVAVFEEETLAVEVAVMAMERETKGDRDTDVVPVDVFDGRTLVVRVDDPLCVFDRRLDDDIVGVPVVVFDELIVPVVVFDIIKERVKALVSVPVEVALEVTEIPALAVGVLDGRAVAVSGTE